MWRRVGTAILVVSLFLTMAAPAALAAVTVRVGGAALSFDVPPRVENGRTLVPMRVIFEKLGASIHWDGKTQTVTAVHPATGTVIVLQVGSSTAQVSERPVTLDVPARLDGGRVLVPLRFVSEALGADVKWDDETGTIDIIPGARLLAGEAGTAGQQDLSAARVQLALKATVQIETDIGLGSGFFIDGDGTVVTNFHVIEDAEEVTVRTHDERTHAVTELVAADPDQDVAVLRTDARGYPWLPLAPDAKVQSGQRVLAVGNPLGLFGTVSDGIVSNPDRRLGLVRYVQHTAPISPGSSGGPLVLESTGEVIGMNTLTVAGRGEIAQNINLAVPAGVIREVVAEGVEATAAEAGAGETPVADLPSLPDLEGGVGELPDDPELARYLSWFEKEFRPGVEECQALAVSWMQQNPNELDLARRSLMQSAGCFRDVARKADTVKVPAVLAEYHSHVKAIPLGLAQAYEHLAVYFEQVQAGDLRKAQLALARAQAYLMEVFEHVQAIQEIVKQFE